MLKLTFKSLLLGSLILSFFKIHAQQPLNEPCGYQHEVEKIIKKRPNFIAWQNEWYKQVHEEYNELQSTKRRVVADTEFYEIPIVFHVIYNTVAQNISSALIINQLNELNLDFRKLNGDTTRIRSIFKPLAADVRIQFKLASKDPNGNPTTGINRVPTTVSTFAFDNNGQYSYNEDMKITLNGGQDAWDPSKYLNIWICNMELPSNSTIVYGFATPPTGAPNWNPNTTRDTLDMTTGAVFHYKIVGKNNPLAPSGLKEGNTATHEIGHYLGLRHIWGDATIVSQGCNVDDGIFDTPNAKDKNYSCSDPNRNTCTDAANDKPDMTENYMDYALDGCSSMFTKEQAFVMRYVLNRFRTGLPSRKISYDTLSDFPNTKISIYPNPSSGRSRITVLINNNDDNLIFNLALIDSNGKQILTQKVKANIIDYLFVEPYAPSVYYLIITDEFGKQINKQKILVMP